MNLAALGLRPCGACRAYVPAGGCRHWRPDGASSAVARAKNAARQKRYRAQVRAKAEAAHRARVEQEEQLRRIAAGSEAVGKAGGA